MDGHSSPPRPGRSCPPTTPSAAAPGPDPVPAPSEAPGSSAQRGAPPLLWTSNPALCPCPGRPGTEQDADALDPGRPPAARLLPGFRAARDQLEGQHHGTRLPGVALQLPAGGTVPPALLSPSETALAQGHNPEGPVSVRLEVWPRGPTGSAAGGCPPRDPEHGVCTGRPRPVSERHARRGPPLSPTRHGPRRDHGRTTMDAHGISPGRRRRAARGCHRAQP